MADRLRWGILATGNIAHAFARGVAESKTGVLVASASRSLDKATAFAEKHGGKAYGSYEGLLADPDVEAVYIASPHHLHKDHTIMTARAGKHVLCEKPFTLNLREAEEALAAVREAGVFFMEAFMYRCAPQTLKVKELLDEGAIGDPLQANLEFGFDASRDWTNFRAEGDLGGGGLMDVGCYCVSFARMVFGEPESATYRAWFTDRGADGTGSGLLSFAGGAQAHFGTGVHVSLRNEAVIYGTKGRIEVPSPWFADGKIRVIRGGETEEIDAPLGTSLYALEADAVAEYLEAKECPHMSVADTLGNMRTLDRLRESCGFTFAAADEG